MHRGLRKIANFAEQNNTVLSSANFGQSEVGTNPCSCTLWHFYALKVDLNKGAESNLIWLKLLFQLICLGFHLHLLVFPFVYEFNFRILALVCLPISGNLAIEAKWIPNIWCSNSQYRLQDLPVVGIATVFPLATIVCTYKV